MITRLNINFVLCILVACTDLPTAPTHFTDSNIREASFRYLIQHNGSGLPPADLSLIFLANARLDSLYLARDYEDPSDDVLLRFASDSARVTKFSQCKRINTEYYDVTTGEQGILFFLDRNIQYTSDTVARTFGGYHMNGLNAEGSFVYLHFSGNVWQVDSTRVKWVS